MMQKIQRSNVYLERLRNAVQCLNYAELDRLYSHIFMDCEHNGYKLSILELEMLVKWAALKTIRNNP